MPDNPQQLQQVQIQLQIEDAIANGAYVNMALLNHNETEFVIDFIYVQPQVPKAVVRARIINSPKHMKRLLHALQDNVAKYEAQFGKIDRDEPGHVLRLADISLLSSRRQPGSTDPGVARLLSGSRPSPG